MPPIIVERPAGVNSEIGVRSLLFTFLLDSSCASPYTARMARPLRVDIAGGVYHVTNRGLEQRAIVRDDADRLRWHKLLDVVATRRRWRVFAWVLLDNHFHLFLQTPDADLSPGMHDLESGYASGFNRRHERRGPLFQG
ncbi:MAG: hypothetical protein FJ290_32760, partial [Planctomycetes bacterium]|nr:hypothetical protein [Planctomycetota bacterium]